MRFLRIPLPFFLILLLSIPVGWAQSSSASKPVIIRDTGVADASGEEKPREPVQRDPALSKKNIEIGNFYYKKKNYGGAISRYLSALEYMPDSVRAYESLVKAYNALLDSYEAFLNSTEERGQIDQAVDSFKEYLKYNPDSDRFGEFQEKLSKLREKSPNPAR
jgi:tetratricopeptide (TPR) repeat protein